ncbi:MAG: hypothetical protein IJ467_02670 [Bacteroidaceae bacterium]|nr:hypothetical protein [Bacteroidaceae bacterium]
MNFSALLLSFLFFCHRGLFALLVALAGIFYLYATDPVAFWSILALLLLLFLFFLYIANFTEKERNMSDGQGE